LPLPAGCPPYATTIILGTIVARCAITLPFVFWSRKRARVFEDLVKPEVSKHALVLRKQLAIEAAKTKKPPSVEVRKEMSRQLRAKQKELAAKHRATPWLTLAIPPLVNIPLFVALTYMLRIAVTPPTPLAAESFMSLASLASRDLSGVMPLCAALVFIANVEMGRGRGAPAQSMGEGQISQFGRIWLPRIENGLRGMTVAFFWIAYQSPGALVLYWTTSGAFTLVERLTLAEIDQRRAARRAKLIAPPLTSPGTPTSPKAPAPLLNPPPLHNRPNQSLPARPRSIPSRRSQASSPGRPKSFSVFSRNATWRVRRPAALSGNEQSVGITKAYFER